MLIRNKKYISDSNLEFIVLKFLEIYQGPTRAFS
jgi:hypothetical protein